MSDISNIRFRLQFREEDPIKPPGLTKMKPEHKAIRTATGKLLDITKPGLLTYKETMNALRGILRTGRYDSSKDRKNLMRMISRAFSREITKGYGLKSIDFEDRETVMRSLDLVGKISPSEINLDLVYFDVEKMKIKRGPLCLFIYSNRSEAGTNIGYPVKVNNRPARIETIFKSDDQGGAWDGDWLQYYDVIMNTLETNAFVGRLPADLKRERKEEFERDIRESIEIEEE